MLKDCEFRLNREETVKGVGSRFAVRASAAGCALVLSLALGLGAALAQDKTYTMKISLPTINDPSYFFAKAYAAALEKDSGGRIKAQIFPSSQLGSIPRQIEGTQFGSIQCVLLPPEFFVGVDNRFEIMAVPGLIESMAQGQRIAADPAVHKMMLGLGDNKGLHGVALFMNTFSSVISRAPIRHLADFKGKKIRVTASPFQMAPITRLGATPVAISLGDVIPALQQGAIDGAVGADVVFTTMHFNDAAKYVTETNGSAIFIIVELNKAWYDLLPGDLKKIVDDDAATEQTAIAPVASDVVSKARKGWTAAGGELISLPPDEQAQLMKTSSSAVAEIVKSKPSLEADYEVLKAAAQRTQ
jgi:TRAP-type transport system periplasmic protein